MYSFDFAIFIKRLLPWFLYKDKHKAWLYVLLKPIQALYATFVDAKAAVFYKLQFTSQVNSLETLLNDQFNSGLPAYTGATPTGIYISDPSSFIPPVYLYNKVELRPAIILHNNSESASPTYVYNTIEYQLQYDFVVNVPIAVGDVTDPIFVSKIKAWIDFYRLAGKRYVLVNY